ncbi:MAG TPA: RecX family transcriptional regulator [Bryobacteraceae bacterium]|jgi:regulatory protein
MEFALRALSGRALSTSELRERLRKRAAGAADVDAVIAKLKDAGYLDDRRFAESFASARKENQGFGRMRVIRDLRQRRVAPGLAEKAADQAFEGSDEAQLVGRYLERKYRNVELASYLSEDKNLASAFRRLRHAGFSAATSIRVLKRYAAKADELEAMESEQDSDAE